MFFPFSLLPIAIFFVIGWFGIRSIVSFLKKHDRSDKLFFRNKYSSLLGFLDSDTKVKKPKSLQGQIFRLAQKNKGRITLSDVIIETGMNMEEAEKILDKMTDGVHIQMEVRDNGIVVYEFPEIIDRFEKY